MNAWQAREENADERERMERFGNIQPQTIRRSDDAGRSMRGEFFAEHPELAPPCERVNNVIQTSKGAA
jgi:hypothetical protein